ncbi:MAG: ADP-ribosylglycohydrolase family protein [Bacteroidales bacterium]|nr:ADP-ribosylglycohydrolase family protein [Bacteroidales bacterium]
MKQLAYFVSALLLLACCSGILASCDIASANDVTMTKARLLDKVKGGWAGQTIGVTYGAPTEFRYQGRMIPDSVEIPWGDPDYICDWMNKFPGLYDDVYMDLTFVETYRRLGIDAPVDSLALAFANAEYMLWEANQTARYNLLNGIKPPLSGYWKNNPHADDIDFQIEADFAGLMAPGMPNTAATICDSVGHIMNYGDGWYGGVYMAAMYSLAYVSNDIEYIVEEALKCIPDSSRYHRIISDVINTYRQNPDDWTAAWQLCAEKWDKTLGCPTGAYKAYNIDAALNSAYVVIGLLYGHGDFGRTLEISTRCGQDSDCNPASAGGILGTMLGYDSIPALWIEPLKKAEDMKFKYTSSSLLDTYTMSFDQALEVIERNGGKIGTDNVTIRCQKPQPVRLEQSFPGYSPLRKTAYNQVLNESPLEAPIDGNAIVITGVVSTDGDPDYIAEVEVAIDGKILEISKMPARKATRKHDVYWNYDLDGRPHQLSVRLLNPNGQNSVTVYSVFEQTRE